jgi:arginyl-tRNA synthetase
MVSENPFAILRLESQKALDKALKKLHPEAQIASHALARPPNPEFGQLASSLCFELAKQASQKPNDLAKHLAETISKEDLTLIDHVAPAGGYVNFHLNFTRFTELTIDSVEHFDGEYGLVKTEKSLKVIVEHTSANPLHPIHIGQARNPVLGDTIARLLKARGHTVAVHYYIDDVGRQSSVIAYGYEKLGKPKPQGKPDHFLGEIYTVTSCLVEINRFKRELERAKAVNAEEEIAKITKELDEWVAIAAELKQKYPALFDELLEKIGKDENPEESVSALNRDYEAGNRKARQLVRGVSELCFDGFKETLGKIGVSYDSWDWEGDIATGDRVANVLSKLKKSPYVSTEEGVLEFDAEKVIRELDLRARVGLRETQEVPPLTLVRSDGTTLYTTRDVAYTLWKFERAEKVINVIGMEQSLAQLQLKIALYAIGYAKQADSLVHFAYNLVSLPGYKMSSRRGHYITFDEVMDEAVKRAFEEVSKRSPELSEEEKRNIANFVGIGAVRFALVEVDTSKPVVFTWDRVLNFERNSAPYIQYTHARACSILRKAGHEPTKPNYSLLTDRLEHELVLMLASFPDAFTEASDYLKPNTIADYANNLADKFNTFYNALPVLKAETPETSEARLALVDAVRIVLRNALSLIGVVAPERM